MEIEAKFCVPDRETMQRLQVVDRLASFTLQAGPITQVTDTYVDTPDRRIIAAGYACRIRYGDDNALLTLKGLAAADGAVHRRLELESALPPDPPLDPHKWPASAACNLVLSLAGEMPLQPLFELRQTRQQRPVLRDATPIATLSLDEVNASVSGQTHAYLELEIELQPGGTEEDLAALAAHLRDEWHLKPEPRSKFQRALASLDTRGQPGALLSAAERSVLSRVTCDVGRYRRRARALLALDEGLSVVEAGQHASLSAQRVRFWRRQFQQRRLDILPPRVRAGQKPVSERAHRRRPRAQTQAAGAASAAPAQVPSAEPQAVPQIVLPSRPGMERDDSMPEAARKTLLFHLQRMLFHEPGTRLGQDAEELHDMRVATRRMRAALAVFADDLNDQAVAPFLKGLRRTGRVLGSARDLDVFRGKLQDYIDDLPAGQPGGLEPLLAAWESQRTFAREALLAYLDGERYADFKEEFQRALETPESWRETMGSPSSQAGARRVRWAVPALIYERMAEARACAEPLARPGAALADFHRLRIAGKGLRYAFEFFEEVLGSDTAGLIKTMKDLQDHLGNLQDAVVACGLLRDFLTWGGWGQPEGKRPPHPAAPVVAPGVVIYLAFRQTELQQLLETFTPMWAPVQSPEFGAKLRAALAALW